MSEEKLKLTVSQIQADLKSGLTRDQIGEKYSLNKAQVKRLFQHPQLKFKKTISHNDPFELVDDVTPPSQETAQEEPQQVVEETQVPDASAEVAAEHNDALAVDASTEQKSGTVWGGQ